MKFVDTLNNTPAVLWSRTQEDESVIDYTATVLGRDVLDKHFGLDLRATYKRTDGLAPQALRAPAQMNPLDAGNPAGWNAYFETAAANVVRLMFVGPSGHAARASAIVNGQIIKLDATGLFDLSTLASTGWWRGSYAASPWTGTASAGASGTRNLTEGTHPPTAGSAVDGKTPAHFNGADSKLGHAGPVAPTFISTTAWSSFVMFKADAVTLSPGLKYQIPHFWASSDSAVGITFDSDGVSVQQADATPTQTAISLACGTGSWHVVFAWFDGTAIHLQLDNGAPIQGPCVGIYAGVSSAALVVGTNYNSAQFFAGDIMELEIRDVAFAGTEIADIYATLKAAYPSAGLP